MADKASKERPTAERIHAVLQRGLGDRAGLVDVTQASTTPWPINHARARQNETFTIGLVFTPEKASRTVDRGPSAEDASGTAAFRDFWGDKAELRRFKDGEIRESLVWTGTEPIEITKEIVLFLLEKHFGTTENCRVIGDDVGSIAGATIPAHKQQAAYSKTLAAYRTLEARIRGLEGLPLQVRQIQPTGVKLRNTVVSEGKASFPTDVVIQFEGSNRWPDDMMAVQMTKIAFLLKLEEQLGGTSAIELTRLGLENQKQDILNQAFLDVFHSGEWFRLRIHHEREQLLIDRRLVDRSITPRQREDAALALAEYKRTFVRAPIHAQTMQKLATEFPAFSQTARLLKLWLNAQLLGNHIRDELIEIITAKVFLDPQPWPVPSSASTGFLRSISFLASWDWQQDPLVVDTNSSMNAAEVNSIRTKFEAWRQVDPLMNRVSLFVATSYDLDGTTWSEYAPSKVVAARMSSLAKAAMTLVKAKGLDLNLASMFKPSFKDYNFVIKLKQKNKADKDDENLFKNLRRDQVGDPSVVGFDAARLLLDDLQSIYGDAAILFTDHLNGGVIAGLWSPLTDRRRWKVNIGWSTTPVSASGEAECEAVANRDSMLAEIARIGGEMIASVERQ